MYNEDLKTRYITERNQNVILPNNYLERLFRNTEKIEEELGKDIGEFSIQEIADFYKRVGTKSIEVLYNINAQLTLYTDWCMARSLLPTGINNYYEFNREMMEKCINKLALEDSVLSRERVLEIVYALKNKRESFAVLMLYETGKTKEFSSIFNARIEDFDFERRILRTEGRIVSVSSELLTIATQANETLDYWTYGSINSKRGDKRRLSMSEYIYKETTDVHSQKYKGIRLQRGCLKGFQEIGLNSWIKLKSFSDSGIINHINDLATERGIRGEDVVRNKELMKDVCIQHALPGVSPVQFIRKWKHFLV